MFRVECVATTVLIASISMPLLTELVWSEVSAGTPGLLELPTRLSGGRCHYALNDHRLPSVNPAGCPARGAQNLCPSVSICG